MAETQYTTNSAQLIALSAPAQLPAAKGLDICSELIVAMPYDQVLEYRGTRRALEAERVIPAKAVWPDGFESLRWTDGGNEFWLRRQRPQGVKGPRRSFVDVDWWILRIDPVESKSWEEIAVDKKTKELREATHRASPEGRAARSAMIDRACRACCDVAFKTFLARIRGIDGKKRHSA